MDFISKRSPLEHEFHKLFWTGRGSRKRNTVKKRQHNMNNSSGSANLSSQLPSAASTYRLPVVASAVFIVFIITTAILGNTLVCIACAVSKRLQNFTSVFIVNLAVSDILVATISMPVWLSVQLNGEPSFENSPSVYNAWLCFDILCCTASITNLVFISIDRLLAISFPLRYLPLMSLPKLVSAVAFVWLYAITVALLSLLRWQGYALFICIAAFLAPLTIMVAAYMKIFRVTLVHIRSIRVQTEMSIRLRKEDERSFRQDLKAARTLSIVIGAFVISWCPFFVMNFVIYYCKKCVVYPLTLSLIKWMSYSNSAVNPVIYSCLNKHFRDTFIGIIQRAFKRTCCRK